MYDVHPCITPIIVGTKLHSEESDMFSDSTLSRSTKLSQCLKALIQLQGKACKMVLWYIKVTINFGIIFRPITIF